MRWIILLVSLMLAQMTVHASEPEDLYAQSAVLMDAESGRVLFSKKGEEQKAMASTTKIMTCILALENGKMDDVVVFSENAVSQPKVHLGVAEGTQFYLKDLLYSLMLESHNDTAVAIAEHIGGSVEAFATMMNQKALEIGCTKTHYVTPNGLDASDEGGNHVTTAEELALIMSYCIGKSEKAEEFLKITQTDQYSFYDLEGKGNYQVTNTNRILNMMEGALSGKTGYTSKAGYCYVGALKRENRTFVVALLGCGWPNHKDYKWEDTKELMEYAVENYEHRKVWDEIEFPEIKVENGIPEDKTLYGESYVKIGVKEEREPYQMLLGKQEKIEKIVDYSEVLHAPVEKGEELGNVQYYLGETMISEYPIVALEKVEEKDPAWYFERIFERYMWIEKKMA